MHVTPGHAPTGSRPTTALLDCVGNEE